LRDKLNYSTIAIGKWHLGKYKRAYIPTERGFDSHYGYWLGGGDHYDRTHTINKYWGIDLHRNEHTANLSEYLDVYSTEMYTQEAIKAYRKSFNISTKKISHFLCI